MLKHKIYTSVESENLKKTAEKSILMLKAQHVEDFFLKEAVALLYHQLLGIHLGIIIPINRKNEEEFHYF